MAFGLVRGYSRAPVSPASGAERRRQDVPVESKPHIETVTCFRMSPALAEAAGELWAKRWVDLDEENER